MDEEKITAERRRAEAAQWFARLKTLPVSQGTLTDFFAWKRERRNADAFEEAERFWTEAGKVGEAPSILRAVEAAELRPVSVRRSWIFRLVPAAAVITLVALTGLYVFFQRGTIYRTSAGELRAVALHDGSRLRLSTETKLSVHYSAGRRQLVLQEGEALFNVAHDTSRPFTVTAGEVTVTATGTRFDVARFGERIAVTLVQGRVVVRSPDGARTWLTPGQQWRWPIEGQAVRSVNADNVTAWTQGRIVLDGTRLADAIATVNRYGGKPVALDASAMAAARISGTFEAGDTQSFVTAVTAFLPLKQREDETGTIRLVAGQKNTQEYIPSR